MCRQLVIHKPFSSIIYKNQVCIFISGRIIKLHMILILHRKIKYVSETELKPNIALCHNQVYYYKV